MVNSILVFIMGLFAPFMRSLFRKSEGVLHLLDYLGQFSQSSAECLYFFFKLADESKRTGASYCLGIYFTGGVFISYAFMTNIPQLIVTQIFWGIAVALELRHLIPFMPATPIKKALLSNGEGGKYSGDCNRSCCSCGVEFYPKRPSSGSTHLPT